MQRTLPKQDAVETSLLHLVAPLRPGSRHDLTAQLHYTKASAARAASGPMTWGQTYFDETFEDLVAVKVRNLRGLEHNFSLDRNGFQVVQHRSSLSSFDFADHARVKRIYYPEMAAILQQVTGASRVRITHHVLRRSKPPDPESLRMTRPITQVHVDSTQERVQLTLKAMFSSEYPRILERRYAMINVWRPLKKVCRDPLGFCDASTVDDHCYVPREIIMPRGAQKQVNTGVVSGKAHQWYFLHAQNTHEVILLKCWDSKDVAKRCPHSAILGATEACAEDRESIELRSGMTVGARRLFVHPPAESRHKMTVAFGILDDSSDHWFCTLPSSKQYAVSTSLTSCLGHWTPASNSKAQAHHPFKPKGLYRIPAPLRRREIFPMAPDAATSSQQKPPVLIRSATPGDASAIASLGTDTFFTCFGHSMPESDINAYLSQAFSSAAILAEIRDTRTYHFFVAELIVGSGKPQLVGFIQMKRDSVEPCLPARLPLLELNRIYLSHAQCGGGIGGKLMEHALEWAKGQQTLVNEEAKTVRGVWLGVWEDNGAAQRFYERYGFQKVGEHGFTMAATTQTDWIMLKVFGEDSAARLGRS